MSSTALPLSLVVPITVTTQGIAVTAPTYNIGLITGTTVASGYAAANSRILQFSQGDWSSAMIAAGFLLTSPEYIEAGIYFSQNQAAQLVFVGLQNPSSLKTLIPHSGAAGTNYTAGDIVQVLQGSPPNVTGQAEILTVAAGGVPLTLAPVLTSDGTGYTTGTDLATANVTVANPAASGLYVDVTAIGETPEACFAYLRNANGTWYGCTSTTAADSDHEAIATFVQGISPPAKYYWASSTVAISQSPYQSGSTDVASYMEANSLSNVTGIYSTTQNGTAPNNVYAAAGMMGLEMGLNTGLAGSYYTLAFKTLVGVTPEPLTLQQYQNILSKNCNIYGNFNNAYAWVYPGISGRTNWFSDFVTFLNVLKAQIQYNVANALALLPTVPEDNAGEQLLIHAVNQACDALGAVGFIQPGVWGGATIQLPNGTGGTIGITNGQALTNGYTVFAASFATQTSAAQQARQGMPIYVCVNTPGAIQSVQINLQVQF